MPGHVKAKEYKPGDRVVLVKPYTFKGDPATARTLLPVGSTGTVQPGHVQADYHLDADIVAVEYDSSKGKADGTGGGWFTDAICLEPESVPVSEEELDEVYKSLGASRD